MEVIQVINPIVNEVLLLLEFSAVSPLLIKARFLRGNPILSSDSKKYISKIS